MAQGDRVIDFKVYTLSDLSGIRYVGITSCFSSYKTILGKKEN